MVAQSTVAQSTKRCPASRTSENKDEMTMTTWKIDTAHTDVVFAAKHMMVTTVRGKLGDVSGSIETEGDDASSARGEIAIGVASLNTGSDYRDKHLRSADFFDAEAHPIATFRLTSVTPHGDELDVAGDLTIRGTTRPVVLRAESLGFYVSMEGARRAGFSATGTIDRKAFGLDWNVALETGGWLVGDDIKLTIDAAFEEAKVALPVAA